MNHVTKLEEDPQKQKDLSSRLQMKLDSNAAEYHNEIQKFTEQKDELVCKNKSLCHEKKGNAMNPMLYWVLISGRFADIVVFECAELQSSIEKWKSTAADWEGAFNRE